MILYVFYACRYNLIILLSWYKQIYLIKYLATKIVLIKFMGIIYYIFIRRLIIIIIFINLLLLGKSIIKSIKILRYLYIKISNG
jgi:hypothetical protein